MYADYALREFIKEAKTKPWFDDTVFVMIADHTANSSGKIGLPVEKYHIPFLIYSPKHITPKAIDKVISQIDLAPTVLGLLNMDYVSGFFGEYWPLDIKKGHSLVIIKNWASMKVTK